MKISITPLKKNRQRILIIISLLLIVLNCNAQQSKGEFNAIKKEALGFYEIGNYAVAENYLSKLIKNNPNKQDTTVLSALADCYWRQREYVQSFDIYKKLNSVLGYSMPAVFRMRLADLYAMQDQYTNASESLSGIRKLVTRKDGFAGITPMIEDSSDYFLSYPNFNSVTGEYLPFLLQNDLYLTTDRGTATRKNKVNLATGGQYSKLQYIDTSKITSDNIDNDYGRKHGIFGLFDSSYQTKIKRIIAVHEGADIRINSSNALLNSVATSTRPKIAEDNGGLQVVNTNPSKLNFWNEGGISFSSAPDGKTRAYFTGNTADLIHTSTTDIKKIKESPTVLYSGEKTSDGEINNISKMSITGFEGSVIHATVSDDGNVLVFSGKEKGSTNYDLYYATRKNNYSWENVIKFPESVNTIGNEVFPTLQKDGWLYFSSDGLPGLGALDIYKMPFYVNHKINSITVKPEHLSYPVNTAFDDYGMTVNYTDENNASGYFSTNRYGNDDIYKFIYNEKPLKYCGKVYGKYLNGSTGVLPSSTVYLYNGSGKTSAGEVITDADGNYCFSVKRGQKYKVKAAKDEWISDEESEQTFTAAKKETTIPGLYLKQQKPVEQVQHEMDSLTVRMWAIHYDRDKYNIKANWRDTLNDAIRYAKEHPGYKVYLASYCDCKQTVAYNIRLGNRRTNSVYKYLTARKISGERIDVKLYQDLQVRRPCLSPVDDVNKEEVNRRTEVRVLKGEYKM